jgi:hypothetical protein
MSLSCIPDVPYVVNKNSIRTVAFYHIRPHKEFKRSILVLKLIAGIFADLFVE